VVNTRLRLASRRRIVHVIGDDQVLLQRALQDVVPEAAIEHVAFAKVTDAGRRYSARQNRLLTIPDLECDDGLAGVWAVALAMLLRRRATPIDLTYLDRRTPLDTVLNAYRTALRAQNDAARPSAARRGSTPCDTARDGTTQHVMRADPISPGSTHWYRMVQVILQAPDALHRALRTRSPHVSAALLVEMSTRYLDVARHHTVEGWLLDWFIHTQTRVAAVHGLCLDDLLTASPRLDQNRRTP
jgi:hypothetical protein